MQSAAIRVVFAICNQTQPNATLLLGSVFFFSFFSSLIFSVSYSSFAVYCVLSGINFITAKYNFLLMEVQWQSGPDLHFQFNKTSENDLLNQYKNNAGGELQGSLSSWARLYRMEVIALISFDVNSVLMILT